MNISPARTAAFDILLRIETEKAFSSVLLPSYEENLAAADRGLCHEITLGTLRRQLYLDRLIDYFSKGKKVDIEVRISLRIAIYQVKFLDKIPAYSAINESVNLVQRAKKTSAKGFVNAILRRAVKDEVSLDFVDSLDKLSVETSHPRWLIEKWVSDFGSLVASQICVANNEIAASAFRILRGNDEVDTLVADSTASKFVDGCFLIKSLNEQVIRLADTGSIYFQDEASQMVASIIEIPHGGRFLDVCAAPGGKTGLIARKFNEGSSMFTAGDIHGQRCRYLRDNCHHQGVDFVQVTQFDAERGLPFADESFDAVLVDAPCSGTGTIRHNPEIRYLLDRGNLAELPAKQLSILTNASKLVRAQGTIVYSTCSLEREENEDVCQRFLTANPGFEVARPRVEDRFITDSGYARTWPHRDGMDGFFIAVFQRSDLVS